MITFLLMPYLLKPLVQTRRTLLMVSLFVMSWPKEANDDLLSPRHSLFDLTSEVLRYCSKLASYGCPQWVPSG